MRILTLIALFVTSIAVDVYAQSADEEVALALRALPKEYREGASVLAWRGEYEPEVLRKGANGWTCAADDAEPGILVQCWFKTWDSVRMHFFGLVAEGTSRRDAWAKCEEGVKAGKLASPTPSVAFELVGLGPGGAQPFVLFHVPYATAESLGLSTQPDNQRPWLMRAGRINAHVMAH